MKNWTSLAAFVLVLLLAGAADGLMDALGMPGFLAVSAAALGTAFALVQAGEEEKA